MMLQKLNKAVAVFFTAAFFLVIFSYPPAKAEELYAAPEKAIDFILPAADGTSVRLHDLLEKGPVVLSFYRGGWCPVCNEQLQSFQEILPNIQDAGAALVAVSPEMPEHAADTALGNELDFYVLSDKNNTVARGYGLIWEVPEDAREGFSNWLKETTGRSLADYNAAEGYELPVPATFVIAPDGAIVYSFIDPDYRKRADNADILDALGRLH